MMVGIVLYLYGVQIRKQSNGNRPMFGGEVDREGQRSFTTSLHCVVLLLGDCCQEGGKVTVR